MSRVYRGYRFSSPQVQRGQAILLILLVTVACVLLGLSLVNSGILTSEKMQLQNAADSAAYSVSTIEARDLNFTAYTNRAMVANEVALGQMVGMASWAKMTRSTPGFLDLYFSPVYPVPVIGQIIKGIISALKTVTTVIEKGVNIFAKSVSKPLNYINQAYSVAQRGMHMGSLVFSLSTLSEMISGNAKDAELSLFGVLALLRHYQTHFSDFNFEGDPFITSYRSHKGWDLIPQLGDKPTTAAQKSGMERLAAMVNAARDPFSKNRYCSTGFICNDEHTGGWSIPMFPPINIDPPDVKVLGECIFCFRLAISVTMDRSGGSDVRYITKSKEQHYSWTAVDTVGMNVDINLLFKVVGLGIDINERAGVPMGTGGAQIAQSTGKNASKVNYKMMSLLGVDKDGYGGSPKISPGNWWWNPPVSVSGLDGPYSAVNMNVLDGANKGLPRYNDSKTGPDPIKIDSKLKLGFESPYLLIGLIKKADKIPQSNATGRFALESAAANERLAVLGKSEVYFSRPNSLGYFARDDGKTELGNAFNPYWSARLVDTSYIDRTAALSIQQEQIWLPVQVTANLNHLSSILNFIKGFF